VNTRALLTGIVVSATLVAALAQPAGETGKAVANEVDTVVGALKRGLITDRESEELSVFLLDVERGTVSLVADQVSPTLTYCGSPAWTPDGRHILFDATPKEGFRRTLMQRIEVAAGRARLVELGSGNCPSPSPDGAHIAFWLNDGAVQGEESGVWLMRADGTGRQRLPVDSAGIPKWSPDGQRLLVTAFRSPTQLEIVRVTDPARPVVSRVVVDGADFFSVPSWTGEGLNFVAVVRTKGTVEVALVDAKTPAAASVKQSLWRKTGTLSPFYPMFHPATKRCVFAGKDEQGLALHSFRVGEPPKRIEPVGYRGKIASLAFSPDGRFVLFCSERVR
jgi:dipeptidyl aminopeptidase/acylaminoacyl peptidase